MNDQAHPAADLFPMLEGDRLEELVVSMRERGFDDSKPILRYRGLILDGRNRMRAAAIAGVEPTFRDLPDDCDPFSESWLHNGIRRDLKPSQRACIHLKIKEGSASWQDELKRRREAANKARSEKAKGQHAVSNPRAGESSGCASTDAQPKDRHATAAALAREAGVSRPTMERAMRLRREDPDGFQKALRGEGRVDHEQRNDEVKRLHSEGLGTREIGERLNVAPTTISKIKSDLGIASNSEGVRLWSDVDHVCATLEGVAMKVDALSQQVTEGELAAGEEEIRTCIKSLSEVARTVKRLASALRQKLQ